MARFIMATRRAGRYQASEKRQARVSMAEALNAPAMQQANIVADENPVDDTAGRITLLEASVEQVAALKAELSEDVILEPEILHYPVAPQPQDLAHGTDQLTMDNATSGNTRTVNVLVEGPGGPLLGAQVALSLNLGNAQRRMTAITGADGRVSFTYPSVYSTAGVSASPAGGHWAASAHVVPGTTTVSCPVLPKADRKRGWWHFDSGVEAYEASRGRGIRVGIIDSGVGPHPYLDHVEDFGSILNGVTDPAGGADSGSHGSHVAGTIGARPTRMRDYGGVAPGVHLMSVRVFPAGAGANQGDVARAVDLLSKQHQADLINMSLSASEPSQVLEDRILDARERGTLSVCAAGNSASAVAYPARFSSTVAVAALGKKAWAPADTLSGSRLPPQFNRQGLEDLYLAEFSCFGPRLTCAAAGVGVLATVPAGFGHDRPYASMDGTSMASPVACATLAAALSASTDYRALPRDDSRSEFALQVLRRSCKSIGLDLVHEGQGRPRLEPLGVVV